MFDSSVQSDSGELLEPVWMLTTTKQRPRVILLFPDGRKIYLQHNRYNHSPPRKRVQHSEM